MKINILGLVLLLTSICVSRTVANFLPEIKLKALQPRGLKVSTQDYGYKSFDFYGNLVRGFGTTQLHFFVPAAKNGYWSAMDRDTELDLGYSMAYRAIVTLKNGQQIQRIGNWVVNEFVPEEECEISVTELPCYKKVCQNTLIFSEAFDNGDIPKWKKENMFPQGPDYPFNAYLKSAVSVQNSTLIIKPSLIDFILENEDSWNLSDECTGEVDTRECKQTASGAQILPPVVTGKISTKKSFSFKYGRIEVRAKLPNGAWLTPEINLEPLNNEYGKLDYGSGLIRIAYAQGNEGTSHQLYGGPILSASEPYRSLFLANFTNFYYKWNESFHKFSVIWKPNGFELLVDGVSYGKISRRNQVLNKVHLDNVPHSQAWQNGGPLAPFDRMFYISLGVRVGGINDFIDSQNKPWKNSNSKALYKFWQNKGTWHQTWFQPELVVDYVRVYSL